MMASRDERLPPTLTRPFASGGQDYARYRPGYPRVLAERLAGLSPGRRHALDVGCGTGQLAVVLAERFERVTGIEPSADQRNHAVAHSRVEYHSGFAEDLTPIFGKPPADLVVAAQAAHWFDRPRFYERARAVAQPNALIALICYGVLAIAGPAGARLHQFYADELAPYWSPARRLVETGYAGIDFPFAEVTFEPLAIETRWTLPQLLGYLETWSAVREARTAGAADMVERSRTELAALWGDPRHACKVRWPIYGRVGRIRPTQGGSSRPRPPVSR